MFLVFSIRCFLCKLRIFREACLVRKENFLQKKLYFYRHIDIFYTISVIPWHSMQILNKWTHPHVVGGSVKVFDRFIYFMKNWLWQWKSRTKKKRVIDLRIHVSCYFIHFKIYLSMVRSIELGIDLSHWRCKSPLI